MLWPLQAGVGVSGGAERVVHAVRNWAQRHAGQPHKVVLKVDFQNAFNSVDRAAVLQAVRQHLPTLGCWADWCYAQPSNLLFGDEVVQSACGVQQGDPLGPLLFALALQPSLRAAAGSLDLCVGYLDDVVLCGDSVAVAAALLRLQAAAQAAGLQLQPTKCELVMLGGTGHIVDLTAFPHGVVPNTSGNFELLGAPVGDGAFCTEYTRSERVEKAASCLSALADLPDAQTALLLLRHCASYCKIAHAMRVTPPEDHSAALAAFDCSVRECLEQLGGLPLTPASWQQATLGTGAGGLGLRSAVLHAPAAFIASLTSSASGCAQLDSAFQAASPALARAVAAYNSDVEPSDQLPASPPVSKQSTLSAALDKSRLNQLLCSSAGEAARAHLNLVQQPGAGAWLHAVPSEALGLHIQPHLFRVLLRMRLRLPIAASDSFCPLCDGVADRFGDHARACACGGDRVKRHNRLRSVVAARASAAGLSPEVEKPGLLPLRPDELGACEAGTAAHSNRRPADVWLPNWGLHGPAALDLAVTSGMRSGVLTQSASAGDHAARTYEDRKRQHQRTESQCREQGLQFVPLVAEGCGGGWGPAAMKTWRSLGGLVASRAGEAATTATSHLLQALSVALQRENARAAVRRMGLGLRGQAPSSSPEAGERARESCPSSAPRAGLAVGCLPRLLSAAGTGWCEPFSRARPCPERSGSPSRSRSGLVWAFFAG